MNKSCHIFFDESFSFYETVGWLERQLCNYEAMLSKWVKKGNYFAFESLEIFFLNSTPFVRFDFKNTDN